VFILDVATKEIVEEGGITFEVKDYDFIGKNDLLGSAVVPADKILEASGERLELQVKHKGNDAGWLAIRVRPATNYDRKFLEFVGGDTARNKDFLNLEGSYNTLMSPPRKRAADKKIIKGLMKQRTKMEHGVKKVSEGNLDVTVASNTDIRSILCNIQCHVRPFPDPERMAATEFMSETEIEAEALKDSTK
jgi:hypothetical protein